MVQSLFQNTGLYFPPRVLGSHPGPSNQVPATGLSPAKEGSSVPGEAVLRHAGSVSCSTSPFLLCVSQIQGQGPELRHRSLALGEFGSGHPGGRSTSPGPHVFWLLMWGHPATGNEWDHPHNVLTWSCSCGLKSLGLKGSNRVSNAASKSGDRVFHLDPP